MEPIKYPRRCLKDVFGYCATTKEGAKITNPDASITYTGSAGECAEDAAKCEHFITNKMANPYRMELEKSKLKIVHAEEQFPDSKAEQKALVS